MFITASALAKNVLGAVNGMGQTSVSITHAFGPMNRCVHLRLLDGSRYFGWTRGICCSVHTCSWILVASYLPKELQNRDDDDE